MLRRPLCSPGRQSQLHSGRPSLPGSTPVGPTGPCVQKGREGGILPRTGRGGRFDECPERAVDKTEFTLTQFWSDRAERRDRDRHPRGTREAGHGTVSTGEASPAPPVLRTLSPHTGRETWHCGGRGTFGPSLMRRVRLVRACSEERSTLIMRPLLCLNPKSMKVCLCVCECLKKGNRRLG